MLLRFRSWKKCDFDFMAVAVQLQAPAGVAVVLALLLPETQPCKQKQVHMLGISSMVVKVQSPGAGDHPAQRQQQHNWCQQQQLRIAALEHLVS
jgi:hypothetical protein